MPNIKDPKTQEDWMACLKLPQYLAAIPAGHLLPLGQEEIWIDGDGRSLTRNAYMAAHNGADPEVIWQAKKAYLAKYGSGVKKL
jgi:hypothetical protein